MNTACEAWDWLRRELDRWADSGLSASFWWRDDDATGPGAELERLLQLSDSRASALKSGRLRSTLIPAPACRRRASKSAAAIAGLTSSRQCSESSVDSGFASIAVCSILRPVALPPAETSTSSRPAPASVDGAPGAHR